MRDLSTAAYAVRRPVSSSCASSPKGYGPNWLRPPRRLRGASRLHHVDYRAPRRRFRKGPGPGGCTPDVGSRTFTLVADPYRKREDGAVTTSSSSLYRLTRFTRHRLRRRLD